MNYQSKGLQFSLLIHAVIFMLITCTSISESRLSPPVVIDFSIIKELKEESVGDSEPVPPPLPDIKMEDIPKKKVYVLADNSKKYKEKLEKIVCEDKKESPLVKQENEDVKEQPASSVPDAIPPLPSDIVCSLPGSSFSEDSAVAALAPAVSGGGSFSDPKGGGTAETSAGYSKSGSKTSGSGGGSSDNLTFGSAAGPKYRHKEMPVYPAMARRLGKEGKVLLRLTIDKKGTLVNVEVIEDSGYGLADAAIEAVRKSTFIPATMNGKPIKARALLSVKFTLRG